jgi:methylenetetrahydrofolate dehydrogenase (NADP+)/methenyltetrahydrofolate cyclohydrolase
VETRIYKSSELSKSILQSCTEEAADFLREHGRKPCLAVVLVGEDPASGIYVKKKEETFFYLLFKITIWFNYKV